MSLFHFRFIFFTFLAKLEKNIAVEIINNEINVENDVTKKLSIILDNHIGRIQKQKRIVTKLIQDNESAKNKYQVNYVVKRMIQCENTTHFARAFKINKNLHYSIQC